jgi:hypothetical protein
VPLTSALRKAHYVLPRAPGDEHDAEVIVFYFGKQGAGTTETNLARWAGLFEAPDGAAPMDALKQSSRKVGEMEVTEAEIEGTYSAESSPGAGDEVVRPGWKLMGAIVASPYGPYYVRALGPKATIDANAAEVRAFISRLE